MENLRLRSRFSNLRKFGSDKRIGLGVQFYRTNLGYTYDYDTDELVHKHTLGIEIVFLFKEIDLYLHWNTRTKYKKYNT